MAQRRQANGRLTVEEVVVLVDELLPDIEFDPANEDWGEYVRRSQARHVNVRALAAEHGFNVLDLFFAKFYPDGKVS